jgi:hypothetical protein
MAFSGSIQDRQDGNRTGQRRRQQFDTGLLGYILSGGHEYRSMLAS